MRQTLANGQPEVVATGALVYFDPRQPVFEVFKNGTPIPPKEILICDLSDWSRPPGAELSTSGEETRQSDAGSRTTDSSCGRSGAGQTSLSRGHESRCCERPSRVLIRL